MVTPGSTRAHPHLTPTAHKLERTRTHAQALTHPTCTPVHIQVSDLGDPLSDTLMQDPLPPSPGPPHLVQQGADGCQGFPPASPGRAAAALAPDPQQRHAHAELAHLRDVSVLDVPAAADAAAKGARQASRLAHTGGCCRPLSSTGPGSLGTGAWVGSSAASGGASEGECAASPSNADGATPHAPAGEQHQRFSRCMASAWGVGGMFSCAGLPRGPPVLPPTLCAVSPMVTTPVDGCVMLRAVGAGLQRQGVELRARMHGMYYPVRVAVVGPARGEPAAAGHCALRHPSRSVELVKSSSSGGLGELLQQPPGSAASLGSGANGGAGARLGELPPPAGGRNLSLGQTPELNALAAHQPPPPPPPQQQQDSLGLEAAVITISGLKAGDGSSAFRGLLTLECQVGTAAPLRQCSIAPGRRRPAALKTPRKGVLGFR